MRELLGARMVPIDWGRNWLACRIGFRLSNRRVVGPAYERGRYPHSDQFIQEANTVITGGGAPQRGESGETLIFLGRPFQAFVGRA
jgi:hypothetical protein